MPGAQESADRPETDRPYLEVCSIDMTNYTLKITLVEQELGSPFRDKRDSHAVDEGHLAVASLNFSAFHVSFGDIFQDAVESVIEAAQNPIELGSRARNDRDWLVN